MLSEDINHIIHTWKGEPVLNLYDEGETARVNLGKILKHLFFLILN
jgi:hypothetical protein